MFIEVDEAGTPSRLTAASARQTKRKVVLVKSRGNLRKKKTLLIVIYSTLPNVLTIDESGGVQVPRKTELWFPKNDHAQFNLVQGSDFCNTYCRLFNTIFWIENIHEFHAAPIRDVIIYRDPSTSIPWNSWAKVVWIILVSRQFDSAIATSRNSSRARQFLH